MEPMTTFQEAHGLCKFYLSAARKAAARDESMQGRDPGNAPVFTEEELRDMFKQLMDQAEKMGTEGVTQRSFLHRLHRECEQRLGH